MFPIYKLKMDDGYDMVFNVNFISTVNKRYDSSDYELVMQNGSRFVLTWKEYNKLDQILQKASEE